MAARLASETPGPLPAEISQSIDEKNLVVASVLSRKSQLRRPNQSRCARELPDVAAAGGGVCAGGPHRSRSAQRSAGQGQRRQAGLPGRHLAVAAEVEEAVQKSISSEMFRKSYGEVYRGRRALAFAASPEGRDLRVGKGFHLHPQGSVLRRHDAEACRRLRTSRTRGCWRCWATA